MAQLIRVPELGIAIANVTIIEWLVKEGDEVARGQALLTVQTDKMVMEVPAEAFGVLLQVFFQEDTQLAPGTAIAIIGHPGENIDTLVAEVQAELKEMPQPLSEEASPLVMPPDPPLTPPPLTPSGKVLASPLAKRMAREKGIDLSKVVPTGPKGRITQKDVIKYYGLVQAAAEQAPAPRAPVNEDDEYEIIPLKGTRKVIADNMIRSVHTSVHYSMGDDIDCSLLVSLRTRLKGEFKNVYGVDLTYVPFIVKAIAKAVKEHPIVNSTVRDNNIIVQKVAHVGVAIASKDFVFVPVIRNPITKTLLEIVQEMAEYAQLVQDNKLTPDQTRGGTITLTNMGVADISAAGLSIINQPEVASIAVGRIRDRVVPVNGEIVIRPMMNITFTYDHRVVMGIPGARFAERLKHYLENPELLLAC
jgi:pyruvate dehydrogenase E2 component (dihydrolipoamide acetyltransferase)